VKAAEKNNNNKRRDKAKNGRGFPWRRGFSRGSREGGRGRARAKIWLKEKKGRHHQGGGGGGRTITWSVKRTTISEKIAAERGKWVLFKDER